MISAVAIERAEGIAALVVGDLMLDRRLIGVPTGLSAEAPIPTLSLREIEDAPGGAANAAAGLAAMGLRVQVLGHVGVDPEAEALRAAGRAIGVGFDHVIASSAAPTTLKTRVTGSAQIIARLDRESTAPPVLPTELESVLDVHPAPVVLFSDYDKGALTDRNTPALLDLCNRRGITTVVDPKSPSRERYLGAKVLTPNAAELDLLAGRRLAPDERASAAQALASDIGAETVMVTLGGDGVLVVSASEVHHLEADRHLVFDVTGAGDTFAATVAAALAGGCDTAAAARLANVAAGVSVTKPGTTVVGRALLENALRRDGPAAAVDVADAAEVLDDWRAQGATVVGTNGCFDLLHAGHVDFLQAARAEGDRLMVAVNDDESVARLKGPGRPVVPLDERIAMLAALRCVDLVVPFSEDTPLALYAAATPDVLVKGDEYQVSQIVGADLVVAAGGRIVRVPRSRSISTSELVDRLAVTAPFGGPGERIS